MNIKKVVAPISGGKDSQTCLQLATEIYKPSEILGLFCDTQFEHPHTYNHIEYMESLYNVEIKRITGGSVEEKIRKYGRFPGGGARFCTDELKIRESKIFYKNLAEEQKSGFEVWYGVRGGESAERAKRYNGKIADELYTPNEFMPSKYPKYLGKMGVMIRLPIIDWTTEEVLSYLDGTENPLYREGFDRVGCFPCLAGGDKWKEKAFFHDEHGQEHYNLVKELEREINKSIWTSKSGKVRHCDDNPGCSICAI